MAESVKTVNKINDGDKKLNEIFQQSWQIFDELEESELPYGSKEFQGKVKNSIKNFEEATRLVSEIGMFSANELIDELSTDTIPFLLLPYFLGKLSLKIQQKDRMELLNIAEVYFNDYIKRCEEYEVCDACSPLADRAENSTEMENSGELAKLIRAAHERNDKLIQYRRKKELDEEINNMKSIIRRNKASEEQKRIFFVNLIKRNIIEAKEELVSVKDEKRLVEMQRVRLTAGEENDFEPRRQQQHHKQQHQHGHGHAGHSHVHGTTVPKKPPMQPFIITRDATQKAVFGAGYPSLPVMSVNDFYEQRVREGIFPDEEKIAKMNKAQAIAAAQDPNEKEDAEQAQVEQQIERDDDEYLERMRRMDEYKDVVRRGDGNRYNRS